MELFFALRYSKAASSDLTIRGELPDIVLLDAQDQPGRGF
jgi:hypothetical protein